jgi:hypothetical protein
MKTIVETATGLSKYLLDDSVAITANSDHIVIGDPAEFIIGDLNSGNATVTESITNEPSDWIGNKYTFDGITWTQNPDWVDPDAE